MQIEFPIEFLVVGTPVSMQAKRPESREEWKRRVKAASETALPKPHFVSDKRMSVTLFYLPEEPMEGDIDNIVKPILDALGRHIYFDDAQVERLLVQKFEPRNVFDFSAPTAILARALDAPKPVLYVRVSDDPVEDLA